MKFLVTIILFAGTTTFAGSMSVIINSSKSSGCCSALVTYDQNGKQTGVIQDMYARSEQATGVAAVRKGELLANILGTDNVRIDKFAKTTVGIKRSIHAVNYSSGQGVLAYDPKTESVLMGARKGAGAVIKMDNTGAQIGNPFISSSGLCNLDMVRAVTVLSNDVVLVASKTGLYQYDKFWGICNLWSVNSYKDISDVVQLTDGTLLVASGEFLFKHDSLFSAPPVQFESFQGLGRITSVLELEDSSILVAAGGKIWKLSAGGGPKKVWANDIYTQNVSQMLKMEW